jgi:hypothetical protein
MPQAEACGYIHQSMRDTALARSAGKGFANPLLARRASKANAGSS